MLTYGSGPTIEIGELEGNNGTTPFILLEGDLKGKVKSTGVINLNVNIVDEYESTHNAVVQDENNVLYLISNKGKIIWKKELASAVQGKIHQIDIYKMNHLKRHL